MKILVTGGAGFIGSHLVDLLIKEDHKVVVLDNLSSGKMEHVNPKAEFNKGDILDQKKLNEVMKGCDVVFHVSAIPRVLYSVEHPRETHDTNVNGTLNVLLAAKENNVRKVIFTSSSSVCGNAINFPTKETDPYDPLCPYAAHKAIAEIYMQMFSKLYEMDMTVMRLFNVYGPRCDPDSEYSLVISKFIGKIKKKEIIKIYGDGNQSRDFTNVADTIRALSSAIKLKGFNIINVGTGNPVSINEIVKILSDNVKEEFFSEHTPAQPGEARKTQADNSKAKKLLGWTPKVSIEEGIKRLL